MVLLQFAIKIVRIDRREKEMKRHTVETKDKGSGKAQVELRSVRIE